MEGVDQFLKYIAFEKRYSDHTVVSYKNDLHQFSTFITAHLSISEISLVDHTHVRSWIVYLMQDNYASKTVNRKVSTVKSFFKFLKKIGKIKFNPTSKVSAPKLGKRLPKVIREDALNDLLNYEDENIDHKSLRDRLVIDLLYMTGMRRSELIGLKMDDINFETNAIKVLGKGNKERLIPISDELLERINTYLKAKLDHFGSIDLNESLIVTDKGCSLYPKFVYNLVVRNISTVSTSDSKSPHVLRHSFATHMANSGADLNSIKEILGHASLASTEVYMHNTIERLKTVYQSAHPKSGKK